MWTFARLFPLIALIFAIYVSITSVGVSDACSARSDQDDANYGDVLDIRDDIRKMNYKLDRLIKYTIQNKYKRN